MTKIDHVKADWNLSSEKIPIFFVIWSPPDYSTNDLKISLLVGYEMLKRIKSQNVRFVLLYFSV